jgi:erythromycin esterase-like protein
VYSRGRIALRRRSLDDYVRRGEGDPAAILRSDDLYDIWRVESVLEMIEWLRSYSDGRASGEQVAFYGFDT